MNTIKVNLIVDIDIHAWEHEYGLERGRGADDVRAALALVTRDWLRENAGFRAATVRQGRS